MHSRWAFEPASSGRVSRNLLMLDPQCLIHSRREDSVPVVDHKPVEMVECEEFAELLGGPFGRGTFSHIAMHDAARANLDGDEHIQQAEGCGDGNQEVTRDNFFGMIDKKGIPLLSGTGAGGVL